jgi:site-specific recombinase
VLIQLLHWTVATKQPAMTAPAMAAKLKELNPQAVEGFVDEVTHLVRSQVAAVLGNVALVIPCVLLISLAMLLATGSTDDQTARTAAYVLHSLTCWAPPLFAAFTGVLLFASSMIAGGWRTGLCCTGWTQPCATTRAFTRALGAARADRWAHFMRQQHLGLCVQHLAGIHAGPDAGICWYFLGWGWKCATSRCPPASWRLPAPAGLGAWCVSPRLWWCVAGPGAHRRPEPGSVSFYLAFRLALRAHNVGDMDRGRIRGHLARMRSATGFPAPL